MGIQGSKLIIVQLEGIMNFSRAEWDPLRELFKNLLRSLSAPKLRDKGRVRQST